MANKAEYKGKFFPFKCDVSQEEEIRDTFAKIRSEVGDEIAVLINNAGVLQNKLDLMGKNWNMYLLSYIFSVHKIRALWIIHLKIWGIQVEIFVQADINHACCNSTATN